MHAKCITEPNILNTVDSFKWNPVVLQYKKPQWKSEYPAKKLTRYRDCMMKKREKKQCFQSTH